MSERLEQLISPITSSAFASDHWDRTPLLVTRDDRSYYADLLSVATIDELIVSNALEPAAVTLLQDGKRVPEPLYRTPRSIAPGRSVSDALDPAAIRTFYSEGTSVLFHGLERKLPRLRALAAGLIDELGFEISLNAVLSPPAARLRTLGVHYDVCGVLVLQVEGCKHWRVYEPEFVDPLPHQPFSSHGSAQVGVAAIDCMLQAGDCLFIPRGHPHVAEPSWEHSLHLAVQLRAPTVYELARTGFLLALEQCTSEAWVRRSAKLGISDDEVRTLVEQLLANAAAEATRRPLTTVDPSTQWMTCLSECNGIDLGPGPYVARRKDFVHRRFVRGGTEVVVVAVGEQVAELPAECEPLLNRLRSDSGAFLARESGLKLPVRRQLSVLTELERLGLIEPADPVILRSTANRMIERKKET